MCFHDESFLLVASQVGALVLVRCLGMASFAPILSGADISKSTRLLLSFLLTFLITPCLLLNDDLVSNVIASYSSALLFIPALFKEILLGCTVGLTLRILFEGAYFAGETIAKIGGVSVAGSFDHLLGEDISSVSRFLFWIALSVFILTGGCELFIDGFLNVFFRVYPGGSVSKASVVENLGNVLISSFALGLKIAAPVILSTLSVYLFVGIAGRVFPQLNILNIGFSCNSLLTLFVLFLGIGGFCSCFQNELASFFEHVFVLDHS